MYTVKGGLSDEQKMVWTLSGIAVCQPAFQRICHGSYCHRQLRDSATWTLFNTGDLWIEGTGSVTSNSWTGQYKEKIEYVSVKEGITGLNAGLFQSHPNLLEVSLPASLTEIGCDPHPFIYSPKLRNITVASGNPNFVSEDGILFNKNKSTVLICPGGRQGDYEIPSTVTKIDAEAFFECAELTRVTIPDSVKEIGVRAFYMCRSLKSAAVPSGVTVLNKSVFEQCKSMTSVTLPKGITLIDVWAFWGCESLEAINIPDGVTEIRKEAFQNCKSLKKAVIPDSATVLGDDIFDGDSEVVIYCSQGSYADNYALSYGLKVEYNGKYESDETPTPLPDDGTDPTPTPVVITEGDIEVGETRRYDSSSMIGGDFLDKAFTAKSTHKEIAEISAIARTGNIIYADAVKY